MSFLAEYAGTCPCGTYVKPGQSMIVAMPVAMPPDPAVCWYSRGQWYIGGAAAKSVRARRYLHARCAAKLDGHTVEDLEMLAADRRQALAEKKTQSDRDEGRPRLKQPNPKAVTA